MKIKLAQLKPEARMIALTTLRLEHYRNGYFSLDTAPEDERAMMFNLISAIKDGEFDELYERMIQIGE